MPHRDENGPTYEDVYRRKHGLPPRPQQPETLEDVYRARLRLPSRQEAIEQARRELTNEPKQEGQ